MVSIDAFIHRRIVVLNEGTPAPIAARAMREQEIGCILVSDNEGHLSGIVTDRDIACRWAGENPMRDIPISRIMTPELLKTDENSSLSDVIALMENHGVRRIPIVSRAARGMEKAIGIVSLDDLIASGAVAPRHLVRIVKRQISRRIGGALLSSAQERSPQAKTVRSEQRSEAHMHQTLDRFHERMRQATGLGEDHVTHVIRFLLECLTMRVTATAAAHFIAQLPRLVQDPLSHLPPGPDRHINAPWIEAELASRFGIQENLVRSVLANFLAVLEELVGHDSIRHLKSQLPRELQVLFPSEPGPMASTA